MLVEQGTCADTTANVQQQRERSSRIAIRTNKRFELGEAGNVADSFVGVSGVYGCTFLAIYLVKYEIFSKHFLFIYFL